MGGGGGQPRHPWLPGGAEPGMGMRGHVEFGMCLVGLCRDVTHWDGEGRHGDGDISHWDWLMPHGT